MNNRKVFSIEMNNRIVFSIITAIVTLTFSLGASAQALYVAASGNIGVGALQ